MFNFHGDEIGPQWKSAFMNQMLTKASNQYIWDNMKYVFLGIVLWFIFILSRTWINRDMYQILATTKCAPSVFHIQEFQNMLFSRDQRKYWVNVSFASTKTNMWNVRTKAIVFASCFLLFLCVSRKIQFKGRADRI